MGRMEAALPNIDTLRSGGTHKWPQEQSFQIWISNFCRTGFLLQKFLFMPWLLAGMVAPVKVLPCLISYPIQLHHQGTIFYFEHEINVTFWLTTLRSDLEFSSTQVWAAVTLSCFLPPVSWTLPQGVWNRHPTCTLPVPTLIVNVRSPSTSILLKGTWRRFRLFGRSAQEMAEARHIYYSGPPP